MMHLFMLLLLHIFQKKHHEGHTLFMNSIDDKYASVYDKKKNKSRFRTC